MAQPNSLFEKIWNNHVIAELGDNTFLIRVDRQILHELAAVAFKTIEDAGRAVRYPALNYLAVDHVPDTFPGRDDHTIIPGGKEFIRSLRKAAKTHGLELFDLGDDRQGIIHVIAPKMGIAQPGCTMVVTDSHTCTQGGVGALAWGIGTSDAEHVLVTQSLAQTKPKTMRVNFEGKLGEAVTPKDLILYLIGQITADGGNGYAVEYAGPVIRAMPVEGRLTICNMAVEMSAYTGIVAPDDITFEYLNGTLYAPKGEMWDRAVDNWRTLPSDPGAKFDNEISVDCTLVTPQVTWGTSPEQVVGIDGLVPDPAAAATAERRATMEKALAYVRLEPGTPIEGLDIQAAFIGSCTNSRLSDLRDAARFLKGRKVADGVKAICTPGSTQVKKDAEAEGIDKIFTDAGFEWRESGCSLCMSAGARGENFGDVERVITSTNRNFENRQGRGVANHLASPATVALSAVKGKISDIRKAGV